MKLQEKRLAKLPGTFYVLSKYWLLQPLLLEWTHLTRGHVTFPELSRGDDATRLSEWQSVVDILSRPEGEIFGEVIFWAGIPSLAAIECYILWPRPRKAKQRKPCYWAGRWTELMQSFLCQRGRIGRDWTNRKLILSQVWSERIAKSWSTRVKLEHPGLERGV